MKKTCGQSRARERNRERQGHQVRETEKQGQREWYIAESKIYLGHKIHIS